MSHVVPLSLSLSHFARKSSSSKPIDVSGYGAKNTVRQIKRDWSSGNTLKQARTKRSFDFILVNGIYSILLSPYSSCYLLFTLLDLLSNMKERHSTASNLCRRFNKKPSSSFQKWNCKDSVKQQIQHWHILYIVYDKNNGTGTFIILGIEPTSKRII